MTNITESSVYEEGIYLLETTDPNLGGVPILVGGVPTTGHANAQAQQLANRTKWLYDNKVDISNLSDNVSPFGGSSLVGVPETGENLSQSLNRIFPNIEVGFVTTSSAGISSSDYTDDKSIEFSALVSSHKNVLIDTVVALNSTVTISTDYQMIQCSPSGILLNGPAMSQSPMLRITGNHVTLQNMLMDNPSMVKSQTGGKQAAINIQADYCKVINSTFYRMLHSVLVEANGEWRGTKIIGNYAIDCLGAGDGPLNTTSTYGEDRGDAFAIFGATGIMIGNHAYCMEGQDARIAFHCEGLGGFITNPPSTEFDNKDFIVSGNYAHGAFRRHFALEDVSRVVLSDCVSAGGATWWPIAITQTSNCIVSDITVRYTRQSSDLTGEIWSPKRAAISMLNYSDSTTINNINIKFDLGSDGFVFHSSILGGEHNSTILDNIHATKDPLVPSFGFWLEGHKTANVVNCSVSGASVGFRTFGPQQNKFLNCTATNCSTGFDFNTGSTTTSEISVVGCRVYSAVSGVLCTNAFSVDINGLETKSISGNDINVTGISNRVFYVNNCRNIDGTGKLAVGGNLAGTILSDYKWNLGDNLGYFHAWKYDVAGISSATSALNTFGKYAGRSIVATDDFVYTSSGRLATSPWIKSGTSTVTPT